MKDASDNVTPIRPGQSTGSNGGNGSHGERLARIEEKLEHMATREDLKTEVNKVLFWFVGVLFTVIGILSWMIFKLVTLLPAV